MQKALATFGWDDAAPLLDLALPTFRDYAARHGYHLIVASRRCDRPASWCKIPLLQELLASYDFVLWIDADAIILDASIDLATVIPDDAYQAFVVTNCGEGVGESPNLGVWALRAVPRAKELLDAIWSQEDFIDQGWEQMALMRLLGWTLERPFFKARASEWDAGTHIIGEEWNAQPMYSIIGYQPARIRHFAGATYYRKRFEMQTDLARLERRWPRYWLGSLERRLRRHPMIYTRARWLSAKFGVRGLLTRS